MWIKWGLVGAIIGFLLSSGGILYQNFGPGDAESRGFVLIPLYILMVPIFSLMTSVCSSYSPFCIYSFSIVYYTLIGFGVSAIIGGILEKIKKSK